MTISKSQLDLRTQIRGRAYDYFESGVVEAQFGKTPLDVHGSPATQVGAPYKNKTGVWNLYGRFRRLLPGIDYRARWEWAGTRSPSAAVRAHLGFFDTLEGEFTEIESG